MPLSASRRPLSSGEKLLFIGCPLLLLLLGGGTLFNSIRNGEPSIAFPKESFVTQPNGYNLYLQAMAAIMPVSPNVDAVDDPTPPTTPAGRAQRYSLARRRAWLQANAPAFAIFDRALRVPSKYPYSYKEVDYMAHIGDFARLRQLAREQVKRANLYKLEKQWGQAAQSGLDGIQMSSDIARGGDLMPKLVSAAILSMSLTPITDFDDVPGHLSAVEARAAARRLETLITRMPTYAQAIETDRWRSLNSFLQTSKQKNWRASGDTGISEENITWRQKLTAHLIAKREIGQHINTRYDSILADLRSPYNSPSKLNRDDRDIISSVFGGVAPPRWLQGHESVGLRLLLLRFALQAYKTEHGSYPASLNQLAPSYVKHIPTDYFADNKPFHYTVQNGKYRLWSVGPDGINNGGTPILNSKKPFPGTPPQPASIGRDSKGDWVAGLNR